MWPGFLPQHQHLSAQHHYLTSAPGQERQVPSLFKYMVLSFHI